MIDKTQINEETNDIDPHDCVDWRDEANGIGFPKLLLYITDNDKKLLLFMLIFLVLNAGLILTSYFWCKNNVGIYIAVSIVSYILHVPFYRWTKTFQ